ncbi:MAG TPA: DUF2877 domain-containing protein [Actinomycetota bacterium]|nr:DUF2877 domain-containing protein [Actinomycetota bacterium]
MKALLAGAGAAATLSSPGPPTGWWRFSRSAILQIAGKPVVLVLPGMPPGPLQVVVDELPGSAGCLDALDPERIPRWHGALPDPAALAQALDIAAQAAEWGAEGTLVPAGRWGAAGRALAEGDLEAAAGVLGGAGPGLTPAGDDALCGLFFALRARFGAPAASWLRPLAASVETTALASAALGWAAAGQALAPAHDLLCAGARGDALGAQAAARALATVGHSSGADFACGLAAGLRFRGPAAPTCTRGTARGCTTPPTWAEPPWNGGWRGVNQPQGAADGGFIGD